MATPPPTTYAIIKTLSMTGAAEDVAVDSADDTVYVTGANGAGKGLWAIKGATGGVSRILPTSQPWGVAVDEADDTVYVVLYQDDRLAIINGRSLDDSRTIGVGNEPRGVAVNQADDTVYVANFDGPNSGPSTVSVINGRSLDDSRTIGVGVNPDSIAVNQADDTVYISNAAPVSDNTKHSMSIVNGRRLDDSTTIPFAFPFSLTPRSGPYGVAVNQADDTVYAALHGIDGVAVINGVTGVRTDDTILLGPVSAPFYNGAYDLAVDQNDDTVYITKDNAGQVVVVNGHGGRSPDDTITVGGMPQGIAIDDTGTNQGLIYAANGFPFSTMTIGRVTPTMPTPSAVAGDPVTISIGSENNLAPGYVMDDSTVTWISFDGGVTQLSATRPNPLLNQWRVTAPAGAVGSTATVTVRFKGGLTASAGTFTYAAPTPTPTPVYPPGAPTDVKAVAGNGSATVSWTAPTYAGSYPITNYRVVSQPDGLGCLVSAPTTSCTVSGLTNGTAYTFTVEALNGAGWGAPSAPSAPVTPSGPVVVVRIDLSQGTRIDNGMHDRIVTGGTSVGIPAGEKLTPHIRYQGQSTFSDGVATIIVRADGTFEWSRQIRRNRGLTAYVSWQSTDSNKIYWARVR